MFRQRGDSYFESRRVDLSDALIAFPTRPFLTTDLNAEKYQNVFFPERISPEITLESVQEAVQHGGTPVYQLWENIKENLIDRAGRRHSLASLIDECISLEGAALITDMYSQSGTEEVFNLLVAHVTLQNIVKSDRALLKRIASGKADTLFDRYGNTVQVKSVLSGQEAPSIEIGGEIVSDIIRPRFRWGGKQQVNRNALGLVLCEFDAALKSVSDVLGANTILIAGIYKKVAY